MIFIDCYHSLCGINYHDERGVHCKSCGGDDDTLPNDESEIIISPDKLFNPSVDPPRVYIDCCGYKCRQDDWFYQDTGVWCTSCHGPFLQSVTGLTLLKNRFDSKKYTVNNVLNDFPPT